jgi:chromosome segregation ATPase
MVREDAAAFGSRVADLLDELSFQDVRCQELERQLREAEETLARYQLEIARLEERLELAAAQAPSSADEELQASAALINQLQRDLAIERQRADEAGALTIHTEERQARIDDELDLAYSKLEAQQQKEIDNLKMWLSRIEEIEKEIASRDARIAELEAKLAEPRPDPEELQRLQDELSIRPTPDQLQSLKQRLYAESEQRLALNQKYEDQVRKVQIQKQNLDQMTAIAETNEKLLKERDARIEELTKQSDAAREAASRAETDAEMRIHEITKNFTEEHHEQAREIERLKRELESRVEPSKLRSAEEALSRVQGALMEAQDLAKQARARSDETLKKLREREAEIAELQAQIKAAPNPDERLKAQLEAQKKTIERLHEEMEEAQAEFENTLKLQKETLEKAHAQSKHDLEPVQARAKELEEKIKTLERELADEKSQRETAATTLSSREALLRTLQAAAQKSKDRIGQLEDDMHRREADIKRLEDLLNEQKKQYEAQLQELQAKLEADRATAQEQLTKLRPQAEQLESLNERIEQLTRDREELKAKADGLSQQLANLKPILQRAQDELRARQERIAELEKRPEAPKPAPEPAAAFPEHVRRREERVAKLQEEIESQRSALSARVDKLKAGRVPTGFEFLDSGLVQIGDCELTITKAGFGLGKKNLAIKLLGINERFLRAAVTEHLEQGEILNAKLDIKKFGDTIEAKIEMRNEVTIKLYERYETNFTIAELSDEARTKLKNALNFYSSPAGRG